MAGIGIIGNMDISWVVKHLCPSNGNMNRDVWNRQVHFCETLASYPNDPRFNIFTLTQLSICKVLRDVARSCTYRFTTKFGDPWLLAQQIPTSTSLSLLSLLLLLLPPLLLLLLLLSWACCKGAAAPAQHWNEQVMIWRDCEIAPGKWYVVILVVILVVIWYNSRIQNLDQYSSIPLQPFPK